MSIKKNRSQDREDIALSKIAEKRDRPGEKLVKHEDAWKLPDIDECSDSKTKSKK